MGDTVQRPIRINRAPVLTLWAAVVAERLGFERGTAITLGQALAGMSAHAKAVSLGIAEPAAEQGSGGERRRAGPETELVELLGRSIPVARTPAGLRALDKGRPADPMRLERYLVANFNDRREEVRAAMAGEEHTAGTFRRGHRTRIALDERLGPIVEVVPLQP